MQLPGCGVINAEPVCFVLNILFIFRHINGECIRGFNVDSAPCFSGGGGGGVIRKQRILLCKASRYKATFGMLIHFSAVLWQAKSYFITCKCSKVFLCIKDIKLANHLS